MKTTDEERLQIIIRTGRDLQSYIHSQGLSRDDILTNQVVQWTVTTPLYNIGEHVYQLSSAFKEQYPNIPWFLIAGMRHRLVHDYEGTNWSVVAEAALKDVPAFIDQLERIVSQNSQS